MSNKFRALKVKYDSEINVYISFCKEVRKQITSLLENNKIALAVPMSYRVKEWNSIYNKVQGKEYSYEDLADINDLAGIRIIVLFQSDIVKIQEILRDNFEVKREEDTAYRLADNQFGYGSIHLEVSMPSEWITIPTNRYFDKLIVEIQLRTVAQHTWAAASHALNYKEEKDVPLPVKRSINRVAALLEIVDLEYERVLKARSDYKKKAIDEKDTLNVDLLIYVLNNLLPATNKDIDEEYSDILEELLDHNITTVESLKSLIKKNLNNMLEEERVKVEELNHLNSNDLFLGYGSSAIDRLQLGVYFTHSGLMRGIIDYEFGTENTKRSIKNLKFNKKK